MLAYPVFKFVGLKVAPRLIEVWARIWYQYMKNGLIACICYLPLPVARKYSFLTEIIDKFLIIYIGQCCYLQIL